MQAPAVGRRQTILRLPEDLAARVDLLADDTGASRNAVLIAAIEHALAEDVSWAAGVLDGRAARWHDKP